MTVWERDMDYQWQLPQCFPWHPGSLRLQGGCLIDSVDWLRPELIFIVQIIVWSKPAMVSFWEMCSLNLPLIQAGFSLLHLRKAFCLKPITLPSTPSQGIRHLEQQLAFTLFHFQQPFHSFSPQYSVSASHTISSGVFLLFPPSLFLPCSLC